MSPSIFGLMARMLAQDAVPTLTILESMQRRELPADGTSFGLRVSAAGAKTKLTLPVRFFAQGQTRLKTLALFRNEALENAGPALRTECLNLLRREGLLRDGFADAEVAALAVAAATVEVLSVGLLDDALLAFRAYERSGRRGSAWQCRR